MALDIPHAFSRSALQCSVQANISFYNCRPTRLPNAPATYNPSGAPYAGAFYMGR